MRLSTAAVALTALSLCAASARAEEPLPPRQPDEAPLRVLKARVRMPARAAKHKVLLKSEFAPGAQLRHMTLDEQSVDCLLGDVSFLEDATNVRLKRTGPERWVYKARTPAGKVRIKIDLAAGTCKVTARGVDVSSIQTFGPDDVDVTVCVLDTDFVSSIDFDVNGPRWNHRFSVNRPPVVEDPDPDPDPKPDPGGGGGGPSFTQLAAGDMHAPAALQTQVVTTSSGLAALWAQVGAAGTPPSVDFSAKSVVFIAIGTRPTLAYTVAVTGTSVTGNNLTVTYQETQPGANCIVGQAITNPWVLATVPRVTGTVSFTAKSPATRNCP